MGQTRIIEAAIPYTPSEDGAVATEFCLLKSGVNTYADGDKILFDEAAATETMLRYRSRGIDLMADYEHQSLAKPPVQAPASAKKWLPEVRGGDLYATQIAWTTRAKSMLAEGEYRYFSIACRVDAKTNRCVEILNFALTNLPAGNGLQALVAAARNFTQEDEMSKTLIVALGLNADADETAAVAHAARLAELERDVLALTKAKNLTEAAGALQAMRQSHEQVVALSARVQQLESEANGRDFDALVKQGQADGKLSKAQAGGEWLKAMRARASGSDELRGYLKEAHAIVAKKDEIVEQVAIEADADGLSAVEIAVARKFVAEGDNAALVKRLEGLKALKAEDRKLRAAVGR